MTRLSLERDVLEAEYARMAIGSGRSAAERRRKVAPHTHRTHTAHTHPAPGALLLLRCLLPLGMRHTAA